MSEHSDIRLKHRARKRFGQHFLTDENVVAQIVAAVNPHQDDHLVEIGPGLGVLTVALMPYVPMMDAVELDRDIIPKLAKRCGPIGRLNIHASDALKFDFASLVKNNQDLRIVGNLPYNISTPLMFYLLETHDVIHDMHFMLQKEVVNRLAAKPGTKDYGRLSVMMQYHCYVEDLFDVPPESFSPAPKVNSAVVRLVPYKKRPVQVDDIDCLRKVVAQAFSQRRKTLRNTLKPIMAVEQIKALGIDPQRRAETLSLQEFAMLANVVTHQADKKSDSRREPE